MGNIKEALAVCPILGIIRHPAPFSVSGVFSAMAAAGLKAVEITYDTPEALTMIDAARKEFAERLVIGCGTVVTRDAAAAAVDAGAQFIVSPVVAPEVIDYCLAQDVPVMPGAMTPTEIFTAHQAGAALVKVFPASSVGPKYFRALKGPLPDIKLMAVGGVNADNAAEYIRNGADAVAIGSGSLKRAWIDNGDFASLQNSAAAVVRQIAACDD